MKKRSDEELVALFLAGGEEAFEALVRRYEKPLVRFLVRYTSDSALAEEIFQETFIRVYNKAASFDQGRVFKTWLYTIAVNLARTEITRMKNRPKAVSLDMSLDGADDSGKSLAALLPSQEKGPDEKASLKEIGLVIRQAVEGLSGRHREVFLLYQYEHLSYQEIAESLGLPLGTVKSQMHYALKYLREKLERTGL